MKALVKVAFQDKYTLAHHSQGEIIEVSEKRYREIGPGILDAVNAVKSPRRRQPKK